MRGDYKKHRKLSPGIAFFEASTLEVLRRLLTAFFGQTVCWQIYQDQDVRRK